MHDFHAHLLIGVDIIFSDMRDILAPPDRPAPAHLVFRFLVLLCRPEAVTGGFFLHTYDLRTYVYLRAYVSYVRTYIYVRTRQAYNNPLYDTRLHAVLVCIALYATPWAHAYLAHVA